MLIESTKLVTLSNFKLDIDKSAFTIRNNKTTGVFGVAGITVKNYDGANTDITFGIDSNGNLRYGDKFMNPSANHIADKAVIYSNGGVFTGTNVTYDNDKLDGLITRAESDDEGNNIVDTYATKDEVVLASEKGVANGVATLDENGHLPVTQLPTSSIVFQGGWDASLGYPTTQDPEYVPTLGDYWLCTVAGVINGVRYFVNDGIIWDGNQWVRKADTNAVASVNGKIGDVVLTKEDIGAKCDKFPFFPTLIKLIDADRELSVQVHPSDEYAIKNEGQFGKTEMWYILEAKEGAGIYLGFKRDTSKEEVEEKIKNNTLVDLLNFIPVKPGDCYFVKSGTVHAIGAGITLFEVQQNSSLTYRLYDWGKLGMDGKPRELHIDKSLKILNFKKFEKENFEKPLLGECDYFSTSEHLVKELNEISADKGSFISLTFIEGNGKINNISFAKGDTFFVPNGKKATIEGNGKFLLTTIK